MSTQVTGLWDSIINANQNLSDIQYKFEQLHDETRHYFPAALNQYAEKHRGQMKLFVTEALVIASALQIELDKAIRVLGPLSTDQKANIMKNTVVLYTGGTALSNSHCKQLGLDFPYVQFHLYDPRHMDVGDLNMIHEDFSTNVSTDKQQFVFHQEYFQKSTIKTWWTWKQKNPQAIVILINDIRSDIDWDTNVNDVEIHPRFEIKHHGWMDKFDPEHGLKGDKVKSGFGVMSVRSDEVESKMFNYNVTNAQSNFLNDSRLRQLTVAVIKRMRSSFDLDSSRVYEPAFNKIRGTHAHHKQTRLKKSALHDVINLVQEAFVQGHDWKFLWLEQRNKHGIVELQTTAQIIKGLAAKVKNHINELSSYQAFDDEDKHPPSAPVFFISDVILAKLQLYTLTYLSPSGTDASQVRDKWLEKHVLAHLLYYNPPVQWLPDKQRWTSINDKVIALGALSTSAGVNLPCWIPGIVTERYHKAPPGFFQTRYWAITMYRQFMSLLRPVVELNVPAIQMSPEHFRQWIDAYMDSGGNLATQSNPQMQRYLLNWPWKNPWLHAAVNAENTSMVENILEFNHQLSTDLIDYQRKRDYNTAITLAYWNKKEKIKAVKDSHINDVIIQAIMRFNPKLNIPNTWKETAEQLHGEIEVMTATSQPYFVSFSDSYDDKPVSNPFIVE